jgi:three-Cys-motif partner protein
MAYKDLHDSPFDESTIAKLEIFQDYAQAWIPTFVMQPHISEIHIFDFFAGTGYDKNGIPGSPIRILTKIQEQKGYLFQKNVNVVVHLNEFEPNKKNQQKFEQLQKSCSEFMKADSSLSSRVKIEYYNEDFETLFPKLISKIKQFPSLVYLDQNGIKFLSEKYFMELEKTSQTDFLYFVSSSYFWRFGKSDEFKIHLDIDMDEAKKNGYKKIHRTITHELRKKLPVNTKLKLYPFSLRKGANIHGIIFGASHPRAVDKFLTIGWKRNGDNGDANFDIDNEAGNAQLDLFVGQKLSKIESFKQEVCDRIREGAIKNNFDMLNFVYEQGHIGKHAADCLKEMKSKGEINFIGSSSPSVTYDNVFKNKKKVEYQIIKK